jgi:hypothetical protein
VTDRVHFDCLLHGAMMERSKQPPGRLLLRPVGRLPPTAIVHVASYASRRPHPSLPPPS